MPLSLSRSWAGRRGLLVSLLVPVRCWHAPVTAEPAPAAPSRPFILNGPGTGPPVGVGQPPLLTTTNPARIICGGQLLTRVFAARVVAAHNGPARTLWRPSLYPGPLTPSISSMGCAVAREYRLQFICNRRVNSHRAQFTPARTVC